MEENREVWESGPATYFPNTFDQIVVDAVASVNKGLADGLTRMEVEYPLSSDPSGARAVLTLPAPERALARWSALRTLQRTFLN